MIFFLYPVFINDCLISVKKSGATDIEEKPKSTTTAPASESEKSILDAKSDNLKLDLPANQASMSGTSDAWTLLDCCFGVPLFDVEANRRICDSIISCGLWEQER